MYTSKDLKELEHAVRWGWEENYYIEYNIIY